MGRVPSEIDDIDDKIRLNARVIELYTKYQNLREAFTGVAEAYHSIRMLENDKHSGPSFIGCPASVCRTIVITLNENEFKLKE